MYSNLKGLLIPVNCDPNGLQSQWTVILPMDYPLTLANSPGGVEIPQEIPPFKVSVPIRTCDFLFPG